LEFFAPQSNPKRTRLDTAPKEAREEVSAAYQSRWASRAALREALMKLTSRAITFDEVCQDGNAEYKHCITEYPPGGGNWYIKER
jgi:hypothetical protein